MTDTEKPFTRDSFFAALKRASRPFIGGENPPFGTHIREAYAAMTKPDECRHCDHDTGLGSGGASSDGSGYVSGTVVCCHCGRRREYNYASGARPAVSHGPYDPSRGR